MTDGSVLDMTVRELLDAVAARTSAPGGGAVAALGAAFAAALTGMAARYTPDGSAVAGSADVLRARAADLADADVAAYGAFLTVLRLPRDDPGRPAAVAAARDGAAAVPGEVCEIAAAVAGLAGPLPRHGNPNLHGDAVAALVLAAAAATAAAGLVADNLPAGDPRIARARAHAQSSSFARPE